jgi:hypothetical protein
MDPAMMGGGGAPPMDPSGGGMPPMDPAMMGGAPPMGGPPPMPGGGGLDPNSLTQMITQAVQTAMGAGSQAVPGGGVPGAGGKPAKPDLNVIAMDCFQTKKLIIGLYNTMGLPLPQDILDGPNRDPSTGAPMPVGATGSTSDPSMMMSQAQQNQGGPPGGGPGTGSAIPPMSPMEPAGPGAEAAGGMPPKQGSYGFDTKTLSRAAALAAICKQINWK